MQGKVQRLNFSGSSNIGAFCRVTDHWLLQAASSESTQRAIETLFEMQPNITTLGGSTLIGILSAGNVNGLLVPHFTFDEEIEALRSALNCTIVSLESRLTALGNLVLTNDKAALVSSEFTKEEVQIMQDVLGVEIEVGTVAGSKLVGSFCTVTNRGLLAHTGVSDSELEHLANLFGVSVDVSTINCGVPYVSIGLLATSHAAAAGFETTGPELMRISETLFT
ncbi:MAG: translation initiation factor IF-6 [Promethearchaeota archaeon]